MKLLLMATWLPSCWKGCSLEMLQPAANMMQTSAISAAWGP